MTRKNYTYHTDTGECVKEGKGAYQENDSLSSSGLRGRSGADHGPGHVLHPLLVSV